MARAEDEGRVVRDAAEGKTDGVGADGSIDYGQLIGIGESTADHILTPVSPPQKMPTGKPTRRKSKVRKSQTKKSAAAGATASATSPTAAAEEKGVEAEGTAGAAAVGITLKKKKKKGRRSVIVTGA